MSVAEYNVPQVTGTPTAPAAGAECIGPQTICVPRGGDAVAAQILADGTVLCAVARPPARKGNGTRIAFCQMPDLAALARTRSRWTGRRQPPLAVLPADRVLAKDLALPEENPAALELMLSHEVEALSPYGSEQTHYSFVRVSAPVGGHTAVRCFLTEGATIAAVCEPFAERKISIRALVPSPLASLSGLRALSLLHPNCLYVLRGGDAAEFFFWRSDGTWFSRVGLLGDPGHLAEELAREILTSLSMVAAQPAAPEAPLAVAIAGLPACQIEAVADHIRQMRPSPSIELHAIDADALSHLPEGLTVPAIRLAGAAWRQLNPDADSEHANIVPASYRQSTRRRQALHQDARWLGLCLLVAVLGSAALAIGNWRMARMSDRIEASIAPYVDVASQVAAKRDQLVAARRQLENRDMPLRILSALAEVTPNGVFFYKLSVTTENVVTIDGVADSLHLAFEFPEYLRRSPLFTQIQLNYAQQSKSGEQPVVEFRCTCRMQDGNRPGGRG